MALVKNPRAPPLIHLVFHHHLFHVGFTCALHPLYTRRYRFLARDTFFEGVAGQIADMSPSHLETRSDLSILWPKTVRLDQSTSDKMTPTWEKIERIGGDGPSFLHPGPGILTSHIFSEDDAKVHLRDRIFGPLRRLFNGLFLQAERTHLSPHPDDQAFFDCLKNAIRTVIRGEDRRSIISSNAHDEETIRIQNLRRSFLGEEIPLSPDAHEAVREAPNPVGYPASTVDGTVFELPFGRRVPDLVLNWYGRDPVENAGGGLPFFSMEVKDPNKLAPAEAHYHVTRFDETFIAPHGFAEDLRIFRQDRIINLRHLMNRRSYPLVQDATAFWQAVARQYQSMFASRQTFGTLATGRSAVGLRIDWTHPTEPGQHLYLTLFNCETNVMTPSWTIPPSPPLRCLEPNLVAFCACYVAQQLERRLVLMRDFDRAVRILDTDNLDSDDEEDPAPGDDDYWSGRGGSGSGEIAPGNADTATGSSGPSRRNPPRHNKGKRKATDETASTTPQLSEHTRKRNAVGRRNSSQPTDANAALLSCIKSPACRSEIFRYLDLDETKYAIPFPKHELAKVLSFAFPLQQQGVHKFAGKKRHNNKQLSFPTPPPPLPGFASWTDPNLFRWYTLKDGCMPRGLNALLAKKDARERRRLLADRHPSAEQTTAAKYALGAQPLPTEQATSGPFEAQAGLLLASDASSPLSESSCQGRPIATFRDPGFVHA